MRTLFIAAASALFFAYAITELTTRLWPGNYLALLIIAFLALLVSGLLSLRLAAAGGGAEGREARSGGASAGGEQRTRGESRPRDEQRGRDGQRGRGDRKSSGERRPRRGNGQDKAGNGARRAAGPNPQEPPPDGPRESGTVKWFNRTKGFGFVIRESGEEIFVHQRSIRSVGEGDERRRPALKDGQSVTFVVAEREKGLQAEDVVPADQT